MPKERQDIRIVVEMCFLIRSVYLVNVPQKDQKMELCHEHTNFCGCLPNGEKIATQGGKSREKAVYNLRRLVYTWEIDI